MTFNIITHCDDPSLVFTGVVNSTYPSAWFTALNAGGLSSVTLHFTVPAVSASTPDSTTCWYSFSPSVGTSYTAPAQTTIWYTWPGQPVSSTASSVLTGGDGGDGGDGGPPTDVSSSTAGAGGAGAGGNSTCDDVGCNPFAAANINSSPNGVIITLLAIAFAIKLLL